MNISKRIKDFISKLYSPTKKVAGDVHVDAKDETDDLLKHAIELERKLTEEIERQTNLDKSNAESETAYNDLVKQLEDEKNATPHCCICGAPGSEVNLIIRGSNRSYVCDHCADMIHYHVEEYKKYIDEVNKIDDSLYNEAPDTVAVPTPHEIKEYLDHYVIGQDDAKIKLSVAVYNHYKRIYQPKDDVDIEKSNCLILGHSGSGKTHLARSIAKLLDVPMTIVDANSFTQAGYVGEDVESILTRLVQEAKGDVKKAERGIVFIDEIDKIAKKSSNPSLTRDVSGEGVQQALLKLLEGAVIKVSPEGGRKHPEKQMLDVDTKNILFICSGAFVGIEQTIANRMNVHSVGFGNEKKNIAKDKLLEYLIADDVRNYGIIPELVGRLPIITHVNALDKASLKRILVEPENAIIKQYKKLFDMDGVKLIFNDDALDYIVDKAYEMNVGARALRSIVEEIMTPYMFDIPSMDRKRLTITRKYAESVYEAKLNVKQAV